MECLLHKCRSSISQVAPVDSKPPLLTQVDVLTACIPKKPGKHHEIHICRRLKIGAVSFLLQPDGEQPFSILQEFPLEARVRLCLHGDAFFCLPTLRGSYSHFSRLSKICQRKRTRPHILISTIVHIFVDHFNFRFSLKQFLHVSVEISRQSCSPFLALKDRCHRY